MLGQHKGESQSPGRKKEDFQRHDSKAEAERKYRRLAWPRKGRKSVSEWGNSMCQDPKTT